MKFVASLVVKPHELLNKGSGVKAVFSLAPLPRMPRMEESACSLGGLKPAVSQADMVQTLEVATKLQRQVGRLTLGLTMADRWELASGNSAMGLAPLASQSH